MKIPTFRKRQNVLVKWHHKCRSEIRKETYVRNKRRL
nr:MAG TPA: hypothetical protein [Caudoviricetes sp.]